MAKSKLTPEEKAAKAEAKAAKASQRASKMAEGGVKGAVKAFALAAIALASTHDYAFANNGKAGAAIPKTDKVARKAAANKIQPKWSPKGSYARMGEDNPEFVKIRGLAKAAASDIKSKSYTGAVQDFLNAMAEKHAGGGGGLRSRDELNSLEGLL